MAMKTGRQNKIFSMLNLENSLPDQVFNKPFQYFRFMEVDLVFSEAFGCSVLSWIDAENSDSLRIGKIVESSSCVDQIRQLNPGSSGTDYVNLLRDGGPDQGWFYDMGTYAIASDTGRWCVYCERYNEVAVLGLDEQSFVRFSDQLTSLPVQRIEEMVSNKIYPFDCLTPRWNSRLIQNYRSI
ncbi:hypothetical protein GR197_20240 [Rhizobium phaseoli]|jgi:hypothetical protein|uniref:Uncharacterized protein n=1 Tax=Rhizobium phaseoli TaxID=396 RepID=A0A7K3UI25_9HYPH|nr:hypothetical protein [Rhizobium phaseoli]NEJ72839.1 hypothetical protein [Rhizobium phaseoli]